MRRPHVRRLRDFEYAATSCTDRPSHPSDAVTLALSQLWSRVFCTTLLSGSQYRDTVTHTAHWATRSGIPAAQLKHYLVNLYRERDRYAVVVPQLPLTRIHIEGDLPGVGVLSQTPFAYEVLGVSFQDHGPDDREVTTWSVTMDLLAGMATDMFGSRPVCSRVFFPGPGGSLTLPVEGMTYPRVQALLDEPRPVRRRGTWCHGCPFGCRPEWHPPLEIIPSSR